MDKPKKTLEHRFCLSIQSLISGVLAGIVSLVLFHQHPPCSHCPCCHPCAEPRAASGEFSPWLHGSAEGAAHSWASAECSSSETLPCQLLCPGLGWYRRFSVETPAFHPYCNGRKAEILEKQGWGLMEMIPVCSLQQGRQQPKSNPPVSEQMSRWSRIFPLPMASSGCLEMSTRKRKKQRKKTPCQHLSSFFSNLRLKESQIGAWIHFTVFNKPLMYFSSMNLSNCFLNPFILWAMSSTVWLCFVCEKGLSFLCLNLWPDRFIRRLFFLPHKKHWKIVCSPFCAIYDFI